MDFGITIKPDISIDRILSLTARPKLRLFLRLDFRFPRYLEGAFSAPHAHGANTKKNAPGYLRHKPRWFATSRFGQPVATLNWPLAGAWTGIGRGDSFPPRPRQKTHDSRKSRGICPHSSAT